MTTETTEEFMARFRATGLDMLCEARRREEQSLPFFLNWQGTTTGRISSSWPVEYTPNPKGGFFRSVRGEYVDGDGPRRTIWKGRAVGPSTFLSGIRDEVMDIDYRDLETRITAHTPNSEPVIISVHNPWPLYPYQQAMVDRLMEATGPLVFDLEAMGTSFENARRSMSEWAASFRTMECEPLRAFDLKFLTPKGQSLGPGKEVEPEGERHYDRKRILKDRKRKKLARKSRK